MNKLLTIIILSFNSMEYIFETIDSILMQDYENIELIISDDASKNFDENNILLYINKNKRENVKKVLIRVNQKNYGTVKNINQAIEISSGNYIMLIAGDDTYYDKSVCSKLITELKKNSEAELIFSNSLSCDHQLREIADLRNEFRNLFLSVQQKNLNNYKDLWLLSNIHNVFILPTQTTCFKRVFFNQHGLFDENYVLIEDLPIFSKIIKNSIPIQYCNITTVMHRGSIGVSASKYYVDNKKISYYKDLLLYYENEIMKDKVLQKSLVMCLNYRFQKSRYHYALQLEKESKLVEKKYSGIKYFLYFFLIGTNKIYNRIWYKKKIEELKK